MTEPKRYVISFDYLDACNHECTYAATVKVNSYMDWIKFFRGLSDKVRLVSIQIIDKELWDALNEER